MELGNALEASWIYICPWDQMCDGSEDAEAPSVVFVRLFVVIVDRLWSLGGNVFVDSQKVNITLEEW